MLKKIVILLILLSLPLSACKFSKKNDAETRAEELNSLGTLPYASFVKVDDGQEAGTQTFKPEKVAEGYTFFCRRDQTSACLYNVKGECVKSWSYKGEQGIEWQYVDIDTDGNVVFLVKPDDEKWDNYSKILNALGKLDSDGNLIWYKRGRFHHDFSFVPNNEIVTFSRKERIVSVRNEEIPILDDRIVFLNASTGDVLREYSVFDLLGADSITNRDFKRLKKRKDLQKIKERVASKDDKEDEIIIQHDQGGDVFHSNSIFRIPRKIAGVAEEGDYLISIRQLSFVGVIKGDFSGLRWSEKGIFVKQHQPILLSNNHIMAFDNKWKRGYSRVAELNPLTKEIVWQYDSPLKREFFSATRGGVQELSNGNILIVDSNHGKILEVTRDKEVVWQYVTPSIEKDNEQVRPAIYRAKRFSSEFLRKVFPKSGF